MDLKSGGIAAAVAFILSLLIGIISRSTMPLLIVWPLVFALVFFVLINAVKFLFNQFLPELLDDSGSSSLPGSVINIMEGDDYSQDASQAQGSTFSWQASAANAARPDDADKSIGEISALSEVAARKKAAYKEASLGIDQDMESGYNALGDMGKNFQPTPLEAAASVASAVPQAMPQAGAAAKPARSRSQAWYSNSGDTLPDLDSMAGVFTNTSSEEESETGNRPAPAERRRKSANREQSLDGDFSPKDIAEGIRTVLKKDKEE